MIQTDKPISSSGYGIAIISAQLFHEQCKEHKIRSKKMLSYFDKNPPLFYEFAAKGAFIPISHIHSYYYQVFFTIGDNRQTLEQWNFIPTKETFCLEIKDGALWVVSFEQLEAWNYKDLEGCTAIETYYYLTYEGEKQIAYKAAKYPIANGKYKVNIIGLRKKEVEKKEKFREGYAFLLQLEKVATLPNSDDASQLDFSELFT